MPLASRLVPGWHLVGASISLLPPPPGTPTTWFSVVVPETFSGVADVVPSPLALMGGVASTVVDDNEVSEVVDVNSYEIKDEVKSCSDGKVEDV